jgi:protein TIF31
MGVPCRSTAEEFNPKSATPSHLCHSLIELLNQISPQFKRNFALLQKKRSQRHPFERVATPYQLYTWTAPMMDHTIDAIRAEDSKSNQNSPLDLSKNLTKLLTIDKVVLSRLYFFK